MYRVAPSFMPKPPYPCKLIGSSLLLGKPFGQAGGRVQPHSTVLSDTHTFIRKCREWAIPAFAPQTQSVTALWLVLISRPAEGRRLSWPGRFGEIVMWVVCPKTVTHPSAIAATAGNRTSIPGSPRVHRLNRWTTEPPQHSLANCDSCPTPAKSEATEYLQVGPTEIRYSIAWTIFVYL